MARLASHHEGRLSAGILVTAVVVLLVAVAAAPAQQQLGERYFDETGHTVRGNFLTHFDANGGLEVFGYPITDEFVNAGGRLVQYFQNARFEYYPENPADSQVQLGKLAEELGLAHPPLAANQIPAANDPRCLYFVATGHSVCNAFLDFFLEHGGVAVFGYPIGEYGIENQRLVQAFQQARMEWHPELPARQRVQLTALGTLAFKAFKLDPGLTAPGASQFKAITRLTVRASPKWPVTGSAGSQTIYVFVGDQHGIAVRGATVRAVAHFASGERTYNLPLPTDNRGITQLEFPFGQAQPGRSVPIDIAVTYNNLTGRTSTSFLPWW
nr:hypothetical protein [Chloroflexota bacterium]